MASLTIMRDSGYADRARKYQVVVDEAVVGQVSNGETKEFSLSPGHHEVRMKIDWCGSRPVEFTATERDCDVSSEIELAGLQAICSSLVCNI